MKPERIYLGLIIGSAGSTKNICQAEPKNGRGGAKPRVGRFNEGYSSGLHLKMVGLELNLSSLGAIKNMFREEPKNSRVWAKPWVSSINKEYVRG